MNKLLVCLLSLALTGPILSCKKSTDAVTPDATDTAPQPGSQQPGTPTAVGKAIGPMKSQTIGPGGGTLTTDDGKLTLTIPAGALSNETLISVEPVETTLGLGVGTSYHFLPEGTQFAKPATFTYHYTDDELTGVDSDHMGLANQQADHSWALVRWATIDKAQKTVTAKLPHFSWWTLVTQYELSAEKSELIPGETTRLHLEYSSAGFEKSQTDDDLFVPIPDRFGSVKDIREWGVNGKMFSDGNVDGSLTLDPAVSPMSIEYTAPQTLPAVNNRTKAIYFQLETSGSAMLLLVANIRIIPAAELTIDGVTYTDVKVHYEYSPAYDGFPTTYTVRLNTISKTGKSIEVYLAMPDFKGAGSYTLAGDPYDQLQHPAYSIGCTPGNGLTYSNVYEKSCQCEIGGFTVEPVSVTISRLEEAGKRTEGTLSAKLYADLKQDKVIKVSAHFRGYSI